MANPVERPKRIKVGAKRYDIEFVSQVDEAKSLGECDYLSQTLLVCEGQAHEGERDSLMHEICHAIDDNQQTGLKERQVHMMATGILQVLHDNPSLVKYLCEQRPKLLRRRVTTSGGTPPAAVVHTPQAAPNLTGAPQ